MKTKKELEDQIERSQTIIRIETLILEAAQKDLDTLTTKENRNSEKSSLFLPENSVINKYIRVAKEGNYEAEIWIKNQLI